MKCAHLPCTCPPLPGTNYCCDECQLAQERVDRNEAELQPCMCLHADCGNLPAPIEETVDGLGDEAVPALAPA